MEESPYSSRGRDEPEFSLRDWAVNARGINRENTNSRRFSASYIRSFREDTRSFRSNITISSTASSPGYALRDEIDPATYSFTTALKALQARSAYHSWEALSPDGFALHSKWNEAEKYICNPLSGQVPMECLSAKTLSGRSFRNMTNRITMSAPLVYSSRTRPIHNTKPSSSTKEDLARHFPIPEKKIEGMTRDFGTQRTPDISSSSLSSASTPPIVERTLNRFRGGDSPNSNSNSKPKSEEEDDVEEMVVKDTEQEEETKREKEGRKEQEKQKWRQGGCLSWMRKRYREKHKPRKKNVFLSHLKGC
ncbi:uncharacterized protein LOC126800432 [Argentina anserina]|uniref:uncharacterized protein LOC126800432 n=1 Tax=Argentina anserina TaxID=57926 RepID=UPI002176754E|nr:uncharacterized protein LOC126800432 [Potentilla anserina]